MSWKEKEIEQTQENMSIAQPKVGGPNNGEAVHKILKEIQERKHKARAKANHQFTLRM